MNKIKPIFFMHEEGLDNLEKLAILEGAKELLQIAKVEDLIRIVDLGIWRNKGYRNKDGSLKEYQSVDWYLQKGRKYSHNATQLNAVDILKELIVEPWKKAQAHYDIVALHSDMYSRDTNFVIGEAAGDTVISTNRFRELSNQLRYECIKTGVMHELGHVFGLPSYKNENVEESLGTHCLNRCIMRQGLVVPKDWINMSNDRLKYDALCNTCKTDLRNYFRK